MRRRPSGSEDDTSRSEPAPSTAHDDTHVHNRPLLTSPTAVAPPEQLGAHGRRRSNGSAAGWGATAAKTTATEKDLLAIRTLQDDSTRERLGRLRLRLRNPWSCAPLTLAVMVCAVLLILVIAQSFLTRQLDPKGCAMSYMSASFTQFPDFDNEHTRFASKYSLHLYREGGIDEDPRVKGVPVLFIPGNAGSYKQVRSLASEAAYHFHNNINYNQDALNDGRRALDFFSVDFNEDITAFHGQTLLDQAEYLNDAVAYILSLYHNPHMSVRDPELPDPSSVILVGHSMGGIVARTMLIMPNYQANSINTIVTLSAPHARPPVSFDSDIVRTYQKVNEYWRSSYSEKWASDNPLWHVTLISIAGGGLDTIVPSDYASTSSLVPETHGFTVFTSTIPRVWTGMDHLAITWCDQLRKAVIGALYDVVNVSQPKQTRPRADRMRAFKKWFLTGLEGVAEKTLPYNDPKTLLTLDDSSNIILSQGERLVLRDFNHAKATRTFLMPVPPSGSSESRKFSLITDQKLSASDESLLDVMFCSVFTVQGGNSATMFAMNLDLSGDVSGSARLACKSAASDMIVLPGSTRRSQHAFDETDHLYYLQYDIEDLTEYQFAAVVVKSTAAGSQWVMAEFNAASESTVHIHSGLQRLVTSGVKVRLPATRPMAVDIKIPALQSSLLAYRLSVHQPLCSEHNELFAPLLRQYIAEVHESKFFVNVKDAEINLHGIAPYMPPPFRGQNSAKGMSLQLWSDNACNTAMDMTLELDLLGSLGKLWMRYRTVFATFPLVVVALVLRKQFKVYDETGVFMSFSESMNQCLRTSLPLLLASLTFLSISLTERGTLDPTLSRNWLGSRSGNATESIIDYTKNDLLLGFQDTFFWFLVPFFGVVCVGVCITVNFVALGVTHIFAIIYSFAGKSLAKNEDARRSSSVIAVTSHRQRLITTSILLLLVATVIPYQFAYLVLCIVQIATCTRAWRLAWETQSDANYNIYNYTHSILMLMLWILPINMPVLVVWARNLAVHWLTPFSSHHNILSIMPYILLVETLSTGGMVPRVTSRIRFLTNVLLFVLSLYAAVYGVTYAYLLHHIVNIICAWLVAIHLSTSSVPPLAAALRSYAGRKSADGEIRRGKKRP